MGLSWGLSQRLLWPSSPAGWLSPACCLLSRSNHQREARREENALCLSPAQDQASQAPFLVLGSSLVQHYSKWKDHSFHGSGGILHPQGGGRSISQEFLIRRFWVVKSHKIVWSSCPDATHFFFTVSDLQFAFISPSPLCLPALDVLQTMIKKSPAVCYCNTCSTL